MTNAALQRWFSCQRKIRFRSETSALKQLRRIRKTGKLVPDSANAYRCDHCGGWHLGHRKS